MVSLFPSRARLVELRGWRAPANRRAALKDCSLVVAVSERIEDVERLLDALLAIPDAPAEVVVVDADPDRGFGGRLLTWRALHAVPFVLVYVESPTGLVRQRNAGVDISTGDYLFFLDPSMIPLAGYFAETRRVFALDRMVCVGGVAGCVVNEMRGRTGANTLLRRVAGLLPRVDPLIYHPSGVLMPASAFRPFAGLRRVDVLPARACAWRREVLAGWRFSPFFWHHPGGSDVDLSMRAGRSWALLACGEARLRSAHRAERFEGFENGRMQMRNRYFVWKRHTSRPASRHVARFWMYSVMMAARDIARFCIRPWRAADLLHGLGILAQIPRCVTDPPAFVEPPAAREYVLASESHWRIAHGD
jgi:hypothetical protein